MKSDSLISLLERKTPYIFSGGRTFSGGILPSEGPLATGSIPTRLNPLLKVSDDKWVICDDFMPM